MSEQGQPPVERAPESLDEVFRDLQGFGIEEGDDIHTLSSKGQILRIKFSNLSTDDDLQANLAVEGQKGYNHFQTIKIELMSRAISWINGVDLNALEGRGRAVHNPKTGETVDFRAAMRSAIGSWGLEVQQVLWKMLMVHLQKIEDRLFESLPNNAVMTEVEQRYRERVMQELEQVTRDALKERVADLIDEDDEEVETGERAGS